MEAKTMPVIKIEGLSHVYGNNTPFEKKAISNISVEIQKGDFVGVIGHTGSGKSTFVQHLNGLIKPTEGRVLLNGKDIWKEPKKIKDIRFKVGMVFQYPEHQLFEETVYKDIAFGPANMGCSKSEIGNRVKRAVAFVNLSESLMTKSPFELSGGEKRRVAIAGVLAMEPDVLILDEPTAGLDPKGRNDLLDQIKRYHKENNITVIFVSHTMEEVAKVCNKVIVMNDGQVVMYDKTRKVFMKDDELRKIGLELPQITNIMNTLSKKGYDIPIGILTVEEATNKLLLKLKGGQN
jgi:energy-coupling factor transport system ATP-binding protein